VGIIAFDSPARRQEPERDPGIELWAIRRSALHQDSQLAATTTDRAAPDQPSARRRASADEFRAFLPSVDGDPREIAAPEGATR